MVALSLAMYSLSVALPSMSCILYLHLWRDTLKWGYRLIFDEREKDQVKGNELSHLPSKMHGNHELFNCLIINWWFESWHYNNQGHWVVGLRAHILIPALLIPDFCFNAFPFQVPSEHAKAILVWPWHQCSVSLAIYTTSSFIQLHHC